MMAAVVHTTNHKVKAVAAEHSKIRRAGKSPEILTGPRNFFTATPP
jgi:hypothetical protein